MKWSLKMEAETIFMGAADAYIVSGTGEAKNIASDYGRLRLV
jgi:hypothetical protein